jgi:anti-sigma factor RsiW
MTEHSRISDEELHGFIDGELDAARSAEIAGLIDSDPVLAEQVAAFRHDKERLARIYGPLAEWPLPNKVLRRIEERTRPTPAFLSMRTITALAASLILIITLWLTYPNLTGPNEEAIITEALAAREGTLVPEQVFPSGAVSAPGKRNRLLTDALDIPLKAPDLTRMGYNLASIRIYSGVAGGKAIEINYRNAKGTRFNLYLRHPSSPERFDVIEQGKLRICIWQDDELGAVMTGEMSAGEMLRLATLAYTGLSL